MAELDTSGGGGKKGGKIRTKKQSTRVDLTAMVDLAFLLVTFFMLTTTLAKPKAMDLIMPDKDKDNNKQEAVAESRTLTVLLGKNNKVEWYLGLIDKPNSPPTVDGFGKNGIRKVLLEESKKIMDTQGKDMIVLVKPSDKSVYSDMVNMMDELNIANIKIRAIVDISKPDIALLQRDNLY